MAQSFDYLVVTDQGDVQLTTESHHTSHNKVEDWLRKHRERIDVAFKAAHLGVKIIAVYVGRNKSGQRII